MYLDWMAADIDRSIDIVQASTSKMASRVSPLEKLPNELLLNILKNFEILHPFQVTRRYLEGFIPRRLNEPRIDLCNLALCSRRLHEITTPLIFATVVQSGYSSLQGLIKRLLDAPELGRCIKRFFCEASSQGKWNDLSDSEDSQDSEDGEDLKPREYEMHSCEMGTFTENDFSRCGDIMRDATTDPEFAAEWMSRFQDGDWDALSGLLLCQTPLVEEIQIFGYNEWGEADETAGDSIKCINAVLASATRLQNQKVSIGRALWGLKSVGIYAAEYQDLYFEQVEPFLALRSVEKIYIDKPCTKQFNTEISRRNAYLTKDLNLGKSVYDPHELFEFLQCFKTLECLRYVHCSDQGRGIAHLKSTLMVLHLHPSSSDNDDIGSLAEFECLKEIRIDCNSLLGFEDYSTMADYKKRLVDLLPTSLEILELCDSGNVYSQIDELIQHKEEGVPALKSILIEWAYNQLPPGEEEMSSLVDACKKKGVVLTTGGFTYTEDSSDEESDDNEDYGDEEGDESREVYQDDEDYADDEDDEDDENYEDDENGEGDEDMTDDGRDSNIGGEEASDEEVGGDETVREKLEGESEEAIGENI